MIIDMHAHIYPDALAERGANSVAEFYDIPIACDGKLSTLLSIGESSGISKFLVCSVAMMPRRVRSIDDYIAASVAAHPDRLIGFATLHPDSTDTEGDIQHAIDLGLKGIKLHPDFQRFALDEPRALRIFEKLEGRLPVLIHTGDNRYPYSNPRRMAEVMRRFPRLTAICAHLGGYTEWEDATALLPATGVYVDCSSSLFRMTPERAAEIIRIFGADHVLFGSDYPTWNPGEEVAKVDALPLTSEEKELIFYKNAQHLLGL